ALNLTVFVCMLFGSGSFSDPDTLVSWGANYGPRTTNAEWWRLLTATFVHSGIISLVVNVGILLQVGFILERLVGPVFLATTYVAASVLAGLVTVAVYPLAANVGASGAIIGLYGLITALSIWTRLQKSQVTLPRTILERFGLA